MNLKRNDYLLIIASIMVTASITIHFNPFDDQKPKKLEGGETKVLNKHIIDFKGSKDNIRISNNSLTLDTYTVVNKENITEGKAIARVFGDSVYIIKDNGDTIHYHNGEKRELDFDSTYGAVIADFDYPGFNAVYATGNREAFIQNLNNGEREKIPGKVLEVRSLDSDQNGVTDSAQIILFNGTTYERKIKETRERQDLDGDGFKERLFLKNQQLFSYDPKHNTEKITAATDFANNNKAVYTAYQNQISKIYFDQFHYLNGSYTSKNREFDEKVEIIQIIVNSELNRGSIEATVLADNKTEEFNLENGYTNHKTSIHSDRAQIRFDFKTENPDSSPAVNSFEIITRD